MDSLINSEEDLKRVAKLCREIGLVKLTVGNVSLEIGPEPTKRQLTKKETVVLSKEEQEKTDRALLEQDLFYSSGEV